MGAALAPRRPRFSPRRIVRLLLKSDTEVIRDDMPTTTDGRYQLGGTRQT